MDSLIASNTIAMIAIAVIAIVSNRKFLPLVILFFYAAYIAMDVTFVKYGMVRDGPSWYLGLSIVDLVVMFSCSIAVFFEKTYVRTAILYVFYVFAFHLIPDLVQANLIKSELRYLSSDAYEYIMAYAIPVDLLIALLGSDNLISRRVFTRS